MCAQRAVCSLHFALGYQPGIVFVPVGDLCRRGSPVGFLRRRQCVEAVLQDGASPGNAAELLLAVYAAAGHVEFPFHHLLMPVFYVMFWFYFSLDDRFSMKLLTFVTTAYYLMIHVGTLAALRQNPNISRLLANGNPELTAHLASPFTGGYQHIYSLTMFTVALVGLVWYYRPRILETVGWGMAILLGLVVIIKSNYSFAILFVFAFSLLVLCRFPFH